MYCHLVFELLRYQDASFQPPLVHKTAAFRSPLTGFGRARSFLPLVCLLLAGPIQAEIPDPIAGTTRIVARTGDSTVSGDATSYSFANPRLNDAGDLAFLANTYGASRLAPAVISEQETGLQVVARVGDPLLGDPFGKWPAAIERALLFLNIRGDVAFAPRLSAHELPNNGVFLVPLGDRSRLTKVQLQTADGAPGPASILPFRLTNDGLLIARGTVQPNFTGSMGSLPTDVLYKADGNLLHEIVRTGDPIPSNDFLFGRIGDVQANGRGALSFFATHTNIHGASNLGSGIYRVDEFGIRSIVSNGQLSPNGNERLAIFGTTPIAFNDRGEIAFQAGIANLDGSSTTQSGIFVAGGSGAWEVARIGQTAPGGGSFHYLYSPLINDHGEVAFIAELGPFNARDNGLFIGSRQGLQTVVRTGELLPSGGAVFTTFFPQSLRTTDWGVIFGAGFRPFNGQYQTIGLFGWNGRTLFEIARADSDLHGGNVTKWSFSSHISDFSVNARGQVAYWVALSDSTHRLAIWSPPVPEPASGFLFATMMAAAIVRGRFRPLICTNVRQAFHSATH
jgi:hypothetical protein